MSTLLTKPLAEITFDDVASFCDTTTGVSENQTLEYKGGGGLPSHRDIAKAASALANTFGGTLILGVDDDHLTGRPTGIPGVPAGRELEKQICSILLDNVFPPLVPMPETRVVEFPDDPTRVVIVIRVAQSNATPHGTADKHGNQRVYVRTGSESRPTRPEDWDVPATVERLEWLFGRRKRSEGLHDRIVAQALDRIEMYYERGVFPDFVGSRRPSGQGVFYMLPVYPQGAVTTPQELYDRCVDLHQARDHKLVVKSKLENDDFPAYQYMEPRTVQDGVIGTSTFGGNTARSYEFNVCGLLLYQETFSHEMPVGYGPGWSLGSVALCRHLNSYLELASRFYDETGPVGLLQLRVSIANVEGLCMLPPGHESSPLRGRVDPNALVPYQRRIDCDRTVQVDLLGDTSSRDDVLLSLLREVGQTFNWSWDLVRQVFDRR
jgi:hypothetical protein